MCLDLRPQAEASSYPETEPLSRSRVCRLRGWLGKLCERIAGGDGLGFGSASEGREQLLFAIHQIARIEGSQLESMSVGDGVSRTSLDAIPAKDAAVVIDVIDAGVTLGPGDAVLGGVLGRLDIDAVRGAGCRAEKTCHALLQPILIALEYV